MSMPETADRSAEVRQETGDDRDRGFVIVTSLNLWAFPRWESISPLASQREVASPSELAGGGQELERALPLHIPMVD